MFFSNTKRSRALPQLRAEFEGSACLTLQWDAPTSIPSHKSDGLCLDMRALSSRQCICATDPKLPGV